MTTSNLREMRYLSMPDYLIFVLMLLAYFGIGLYYGLFGRKRNSQVSNEQYYLVGGRNMTVFPVSMSLVFTYFSAISYIGITTEIYFFGTEVMFMYISIVITGFLFSKLFLPIFHDMKLTSIYEYLEERFDNKVRIFGFLSFITYSLVLLPIFIFVPALAFNQATGFSTHLITPILCIICIFYTSVGGLKAVVYTDLIQGITVYISVLILIILGTINCGGFKEVWNINMHGGRLNYPPITMDLKTRHSIFAILFGGTISMMTITGFNQNMTQRYMSLPTLKHARKALWWYVSLLTLLICCCCYIGMLIYAYYHNCDPLTTKVINSKDQLLPLFIVDLIGDIPGARGLVFAALFSAALSSVSTVFNSFAAVFLKDFWKSVYKKTMTEKQTKYFIGGTTIITGLASIALVYIVERLGTVLQLSLSVAGPTLGPIGGIFLMGTLMPWVRSEAALIGGVFGTITITWICVRAQIDIAAGILTFKTKPLNISDCYPQIYPNISVPATKMDTPYESEDEFKIHHLSYLLYVFVGVMVTICIGNLISLMLIRRNKKRIELALLAPIIRKIYNRYVITEAENECEDEKRLNRADYIN